MRPNVFEEENEEVVCDKETCELDYDKMYHDKEAECSMLKIDLEAYRMYAKELKNDNTLYKVELSDMDKHLNDVKETLSKMMQKNVELAAKNKALVEQNEEYKKMLKEALKN